MTTLKIYMPVSTAWYRAIVPAFEQPQCQFQVSGLTACIGEMPREVGLLTH